MYMYVHTATVAAVILFFHFPYVGLSFYRLEQQEMVSFCDGKSDVECVLPLGSCVIVVVRVLCRERLPWWRC